MESWWLHMSKRLWGELLRDFSEEGNSLLLISKMFRKRSKKTWIAAESSEGRKCWGGLLVCWGREGDKGAVAGCLEEDAFVGNDYTVCIIPQDRNGLRAGACPPWFCACCSSGCHTEHRPIPLWGPGRALPSKPYRMLAFFQKLSISLHLLTTHFNLCSVISRDLLDLTSAGILCGTQEAMRGGRLLLLISSQIGLYETSPKSCYCKQGEIHFK